MHFRPAYLVFSLVALVNLSSSAQIQADFSSDKISGCAPLSIQFNNLSNTGNVTYLWSFGNGNVSTIENPQAIYYLPGVYKVSLTITDTTGAKSTKTEDTYITVFKNPVADFKASATSGCVPHDVHMDDLSVRGDGKISSWHWDMGDGTTLRDSNPEHRYQTEGWYTNSLLVRDVNGCEDRLIIQHYIEVKPSARIDIDADRRYSCTAPHTVMFTDKSIKTGSGATYTWYFGDGDSSHQQNPTHTFTSKGNYSVSLKIQRSNGCTSIKTFPDFVVVDNLFPTFTADKTLGCNPVKIRFTNKTTPDMEGISYVWDFGDGIGSPELNPDHTYQTPGLYTVKLTASGGGCTKTEEVVNYIRIESGPVADFSLSDSLLCKLPGVVYATSTSSNFTKLDWTMVNGTKSLGSDYTTYLNIKEFGSYELKLRAYNSAGCVSEKIKVIDALPVEPQFLINNATGCAPQRARFTDITKHWDKTVKRIWNFGDGTEPVFSYSDTISHIYADSGRYKVQLRIETHTGCSGSYSQYVEYGVKLNPYFEEPFDTFCNMEVIHFRNRTSLLDSIKADSVEWKMGPSPGQGGTFDRSLNGLLKTDHEKGYYSVTLRMEHKGCWDEYKVDTQLYIHPPNAKYNLTDIDSCKLQEATLKNSSSGADYFIWVIHSADGSNTQYHRDSSIKVSKADNGKTISLIAENYGSGCKDIASYLVNFPGQRTIAHILQQTGNPCAPASINYYAEEFDSINYTWICAGDTANGQDYSIIFEDPGEQMIVLEVANPFNGCMDRDTMFTLINGPVIEGELIGTEGCSPVEIELKTKADPANFDSLYWKIEDVMLKVSSSSHKHTLIRPGSSDLGYYSISLVGVDSQGCRGRDPFDFRVYGVINSSIKVRRFRNCDGDEFIFQLEAPGYDLSKLDMQWDFGDGTGDEGSMVNKTFTGNGTHTVRLTITQSNGCVTILEEIINLEKEKLFADFEADSLRIDCPPLFVQFKDLSIAKNRKITEWDWDFGDGTGSALRNPTKLYLKSGTYSIGLKIKDEWGCVDSAFVPDLILVNGPEGSYRFDEKLGCVPLEVNFDSDTTGTHFMEWDMGDGRIIRDKDFLNYKYNKPGTYIPLLILSDSFGCSYTLPPIDTIVVEPYPDPVISTDRPCFSTPIRLKTTDSSGVEITEYLWIIHAGTKTDSSTLAEPQFSFEPDLPPKIMLKVSSYAGCSAEREMEPDLNVLHAGVSSVQSKLCIQSPIELYYSGKHDKEIAEYRWELNDSIYTTSSLKFIPEQIGIIPIKLYVKDTDGCEDSLTTKAISAGDTLPPPVVALQYVSVVSDHEVELAFETYPKNDFKAYKIYRDGAFLMDIIDKDKTHFTDFGLDSRNQTYCYLVSSENSCGLESEQAETNVHCTVECGARGDTNRNLVQWNAYMGWQSDPILYKVYRENPDKPGDYIFLAQRWASVEGGALIDSAVSCNVAYRYRIEAYDGLDLYTSWSDTCGAIPIWENFLQPNELIRASVVDDREIIIEWSASPQTRVLIDHYVLERSKDGVQYHRIGTLPADRFDLTDLDVLVDESSYFYRCFAVDVCGDTSPYSNIGKTILLKADTTREQRPLLHWSTYIGWEAGVHFYTIEILNPDGSFSLIGTSNFSDSSLTDWITLLNQRPEYCYRITGHRNRLDGESEVVSVSNVDCSPVRSYVWIPNVFSPNSDGLNDRFVTPSIYIVEYHIMIFNRWGEKVFESFDYYDRWDGTYQGKPCQQDAYMVIVETTGVDQVKTMHKATVTLVR